MVQLCNEIDLISLSSCIKNGSETLTMMYDAYIYSRSHGVLQILNYLIPFISSQILFILFCGTNNLEFRQISISVFFSVVNQ